MFEEREELENWAKMWDAAQEQGIFPKELKPVANEPHDYEGSYDSSRDAYWAYHDSEELLQEDHAGPPPKKADLADQAQDMARAANPVYHNTIGKDQRLEPWTPNWTDGKELEELAELKKDLYELESEMNAKDGNAESSSSIEGKIKSMWKKIDDLSNSLTPDRFKEILD